MCGGFPFVTTPSPKLSKWLQIYGLFFVWPLLNGLLLFLFYKTISLEGSFNLILMNIVNFSIFVVEINFDILTASRRGTAWLICLKNLESLSERNKDTEKKESLHTKFMLVYLFSILAVVFENFVYNSLQDLNAIGHSFCVLALFMTSLILINCNSLLFLFLTKRIHSATVKMNHGLQTLLREKTEITSIDKIIRPNVLRNNFLTDTQMNRAPSDSDIPNKIRELTVSYTLTADAVTIVTDTFEIRIVIDLLWIVMHLMSTIYILVNEFGKGEQQYNVALGVARKIYWFVIISMRIICLCEVPHRISSAMSETQELLTKLKRKFHDMYEIRNELDLFFRTTQLNNTTFSPLSVCTLNRDLIATILGCAATYLIAIIQLVSTK